MNILLSSTKTLDPEILDNLSRLPDTSIFLSLSQEDSQRIINEVKPEIVIVNAENSGTGFARKLCRSHPGLEVYLYHLSNTHNPQLKCCNSNRSQNGQKLAAVLPAYLLQSKQSYKNPQ